MSEKIRLGSKHDQYDIPDSIGPLIMLRRILSVCTFTLMYNTLFIIICSTF